MGIGAAGPRLWTLEVAGCRVVTVAARLGVADALAGIGAAGPRLWTQELAACRPAIAAGRLPDPAAPARRRDANPTRCRRDLAPHAGPAPPRRRASGTGSRWSSPLDGVPAAPRPDGADPAVRDGLAGVLPRRG